MLFQILTYVATASTVETIEGSAEESGFSFTENRFTAVIFRFMIVNKNLYFLL